jgi:hypothetical protein
MSLLGRDGVSHCVPYVETLTMNRKERNRITIMAGVKAKELSQVQAAEQVSLLTIDTSKSKCHLLEAVN